MRSQTPESHACALLLADHYLATGKDAEAARLLKEELDRCRGRGERLSLHVRLWRLSAGRGDDDAARHHLDEAARLAPDRNQFLMRVHETHLALLRSGAARLRERVERGARRSADLQAMLRTLLDLGQVREAAAALDRRASEIEPQEASRLRAEMALRGGDYARAAELLKHLGPSRALAFAAARAGDYALSARTLEALVRGGAEPGLETSLARVYRDMVVADLMGGRRRLVGETRLSFGDGAPA
ncbi:MAG: hypothetical protein AUH92_04995 [Acidobacteria bacterium 13_1_40CM_4_69_4]|nr:MAG: hypothetical protein AUH92_04995 [Acidobacteria bacterium 13_1_40CM_4_69_4]